MRWGLSSLDKPGFAVRNSAINDDIGFFEVDTKHRLKIGMTIAFYQVFVMEARDAKISRLQAYEPYPAPGAAGLIRRSTRLTWRARGWIYWMESGAWRAAGSATRRPDSTPERNRSRGSRGEGRREVLKD